MGFVYSWPHTRAWCLEHRTIHDVGDDALACRIEGLAKELCSLVGSSDASRNVARISALRSDLLIRCYEYFYVVGRDLDGKAHDSLLTDALVEAIRTFDSSKGKFIPHVRSRFKFVRLRAYTSAYEKEAREATLPDEPDTPDFATSDDDSDELELAEDNALYAKLLTLVCQFLDHAEDGRHQQQAKVQRRMVFAEMVTRLVKMQTKQEHLAQFSSHESDTVRATEVGFLDSFLSRKYRANTRFFSHVWRTALRECVEGPDGELLCVPPVRRFDEQNAGQAEWQLPNGAFLRYYRDTYGKVVSTSSVSRWREAFYKLISAVRG
jgi:hypothetical protein